MSINVQNYLDEGFSEGDIDTWAKLGAKADLMPGVVMSYAVSWRRSTGAKGLPMFSPPKKGWAPRVKFGTDLLPCSEAGCIRETWSLNSLCVIHQPGLPGVHPMYSVFGGQYDGRSTATLYQECIWGMMPEDLIRLKNTGHSAPTLNLTHQGIVKDLIKADAAAARVSERSKHRAFTSIGERFIGKVDIDELADMMVAERQISMFLQTTGTNISLIGLDLGGGAPTISGAALRALSSPSITAGMSEPVTDTWIRSLPSVLSGLILISSDPDCRVRPGVADEVVGEIRSMLSLLSGKEALAVDVWACIEYGAVTALKLRSLLEGSWESTEICRALRATEGNAEAAVLYAKLAK